ncbi:MAG: T9SS type A sorting domain-containing protein [Chlorobi bacterium]|nr:T9SS type A sorting domain-containing protein [Chlorobiota bacterium]
MKRKSFTIILIYCTTLFLPLFGQSSFDYLYDPAGNRISRTVVVGGGTEKSLSIFDPSTGKVKDEAILKSLEEQLGEIKITVYPNPNRGEMVVQIQNLPRKVSSSVKVYDAGGKLIMEKKNLQPYTQVDITGSPPGIYFLKISIGKEVSEWKVIKK